MSNSRMERLKSILEQESKPKFDTTPGHKLNQERLRNRRIHNRHKLLGKSISLKDYQEKYT